MSLKDEISDNLNFSENSLSDLIADIIGRDLLLDPIDGKDDPDFDRGSGLDRRMGAELGHAAKLALGHEMSDCDWLFADLVVYSSRVFDMFIPGINYGKNDGLDVVPPGPGDVYRVLRTASLAFDMEYRENVIRPNEGDLPWDLFISGRPVQRYVRFVTGRKARRFFNALSKCLLCKLEEFYKPLYPFGIPEDPCQIKYTYPAFETDGVGSDALLNMKATMVFEARCRKNLNGHVKEKMMSEPGVRRAHANRMFVRWIRECMCKPEVKKYVCLRRTKYSKVNVVEDVAKWGGDVLQKGRRGRCGTRSFLKSVVDAGGEWAEGGDEGTTRAARNVLGAVRSSVEKPENQALVDSAMIKLVKAITPSVGSKDDGGEDEGGEDDSTDRIASSILGMFGTQFVRDLKRGFGLFGRDKAVDKYPVVTSSQKPKIRSSKRGADVHEDECMKACCGKEKVCPKRKHLNPRKCVEFHGTSCNTWNDMDLN